MFVRINKICRRNLFRCSKDEISTLSNNSLQKRYNRRTPQSQPKWDTVYELAD